LDKLAEAFGISLRLILSGDPTVVEVTLRTLGISASATLLACLLFIPAGAIVHFASFPGKKILISVIQAFYSVPTVFVGLVVFLLISRTGPLGSLGLLFTRQGIVLAEVLLIAPVMLGLVISGLKGVSADAPDTLRTLGAGRIQMAAAVLREASPAMISAVLLSFGRAISEVGAAMMIGGNIAGRTRTLTTAISLGVGKGETAESIALGLILLSIALVVSAAVHMAGSRSR